MPPKKKLRREQINLVADWIDDGAKWNKLDDEIMADVHQETSPDHKATLGDAWSDPNNPIANNPVANNPPSNGTEPEHPVDPPVKNPVNPPVNVNDDPTAKNDKIIADAEAADLAAATAATDGDAVATEAGEATGSE